MQFHLVETNGSAFLPIFRFYIPHSEFRLALISFNQPEAHFHRIVVGVPEV